MFKLALSGYVDEHVDAVCLIASCQQVPVYRGASAPLLRTPAAGGGAELHHGADGLGDAHFSDAPDTSISSIVKEEHAANAICRLAREYKRV